MKTRGSSKFRSGTAFQDLLFNMLLGFVFLFFIALILINPVAKKADVPKKADYLIIIEWANKARADVDLWVRDPRGNISSFKSKDIGFMHLERDDLGLRNDTIVHADGTRKVVYINEETTTLRGIVAGEYEVMIHIYGKPPSEPGGPVKVKIIQINPYRIQYTGEVVYSERGQMLSMVRFKLDADGKFLGFTNQKSSFIPGMMHRNSMTLDQAANNQGAGNTGESP